MRQIDSSPLHRIASYLYGTGIKARNTAFDLGLLRSKTGLLPSVCIGNVVVGGSGKTPFTQYFASTLKQYNFQPAILLRGYKGSNPGPALVKLDSDVSEMGDEAVLHRISLDADIPVAISRDRLAGIAYIKDQTNAKIVVLDDGLQHRKLIPTASILLLNSSSEEACNRWKSGSLLPLGYLREPLTSALARSNIVVQVIRRSDTNKLDYIPKVNTKLNVVKFLLHPSELIDVFDGSEISLDKYRGVEVDAAAAIADPQQFFTSLSSLSFTIIKSYPFADHHHFNQTEIRTLLENRKRALIVTEKDAVKLKPHINTSGIVLMLRTKGSFLNQEHQELFWNTIFNVVKTK